MRIKKLLPLIFIALVILIIILSTRSITSSELTTATTQTETTGTTSFIDSTGIIRFASDKGYASKRTTYEDGKNVLEEYFDENNQPVTLSSGYSKIQRIYENGKNTEIRYLSVDGTPAVVKAGYDTIRRTYNTSGLAETDTYYRDGEQIERLEGYWQYKRIYNEKKQAVGLQYLDKDGNLTPHKNGYAIIRRSYNDAGKVEKELYFDTEGQPTTSTIGQYGYYRQYDEEGRVIQTTYLGIDGQAANTNRGYAIEQRSYEDAGTKRLYFDVEGNPVTIGRSQYGVQSVNGQSVYLDEDGEVMNRLDNILNTHPWIVLIAGLVLSIIAVMLKGKARIVFLILYILFILYMTMVYRETGESHGVFELFRSYRDFFRNPITRQNILNNIWLFVPLGAVLFNPNHPHRWLWAIALSVVIEAVQWFTGIGLAEVDDVISNGIGALIGYGFAAGMRSLFHRRIYTSTK